jgi:hypothetical protein
MKGNLFAMFGSLVLAGSLVAAQDSPSPAPAPRAPEPPAASQAQEGADEMTWTGCLVQGSGPTVFILENAKLATEANTAKGQSYVLEISAAPEKIKSVLNHNVTIVGSAEKAASPAPAASNQKRSESDLPKLTAKRITPSSDTCSAGD